MADDGNVKRMIAPDVRYNGHYRGIPDPSVLGTMITRGPGSAQFCPSLSAAARSASTRA